MLFFFFFQAEDGIRDLYVTGVQTCALPISRPDRGSSTRRPLRSRCPHRTNRRPRRARREPRQATRMPAPSAGSLAAPAAVMAERSVDRLPGVVPVGAGDRDLDLARLAAGDLAIAGERGALRHLLAGGAGDLDRLAELVVELRGDVPVQRVGVERLLPQERERQHRAADEDHGRDHPEDREHGRAVALLRRRRRPARRPGLLVARLAILLLGGVLLAVLLLAVLLLAVAGVLLGLPVRVGVRLLLPVAGGLLGLPGVVPGLLAVPLLPVLLGGLLLGAPA